MAGVYAAWRCTTRPHTPNLKDAARGALIRFGNAGAAGGAQLYCTPVSASRTTERLSASNPAHITRAAELLRTGHTVAFPTETVYGLGANALSAAAVEQIFEAKQRPHWDPLIVHLASPGQLPQIAHAGPQARALIEDFWPGPLTLLLPRTPAIPDAVTAGRALVGVRQPNHPVALELLRQAGVPIAAPSANTFAHTSPTTAQHVLDDLDGRIDAILDGGPTQVGLESTVAEVVFAPVTQRSHVLVYRPGAISLDMLSRRHGLAAARLYVPQASTLAPADPVGLPSPGVGLRHYAPNARVVLVERTAERLRIPVQDWLVEPIDAAHTEQSVVGVMLPQGWNRSSSQLLYDWGPWHDPATLAQRLFAGLRDLEQRGATIIVCPVPDSPDIAEAIRDRLEKAAKT